MGMTMRHTLLGSALACLATAATSTASAASADLVAQGKDLFAANCAACHNADAGGIPGVAPPLANALRERLASPAGQSYLANVLVHGLAGPIQSQGQSFNGVMPAFGSLPDDSLVAMLAWLGAQNGQSGATVGADAIGKARAERKTPGAVRKLREAAN